MTSNDLNNNLSYENKDKTNEETELKIVLNKNGPFEFVLDIVNNKLLIVDIFDGGIIANHGKIINV